LFTHEGEDGDYLVVWIMEKVKRESERRIEIVSSSDMHRRFSRWGEE
jgi:hypothetical protein